MSGLFASCLVAICWPPTWGLATHRMWRRLYAGDALMLRVGINWTIAGAVTAATDCALGVWVAAACAGGNALIGLWICWRRRKRRDRAPRLAGYKARAAIAALVAKLRESARSRPVLRPVPGGAS